MKKVLLTGATGFIGRHALKLLLERGFEVHALSKNGNWDRSLKSVKYHTVDLFDKEKMTHLVSILKATHLLHFAWETSKGFWNSPLNLSHLIASLHLTQQFVLHGGSRMVIAGTCAEYAWGDQPLNESHSPILPTTFYGYCKSFLYKVLEPFCHEKGVSLAWGRIFSPYGPFEKKERLVPSLITALLQKRSAICQSKESVRDFLHVEDVANAFITLLEHPFKGCLNIGSGKATKNEEIASFLARELKAPHLLQLCSTPFTSINPHRITADVSLLKKELQWQPRIPLEEGLVRTIAWWEDEISN